LEISHKGSRFIIGGTSPNIHRLPPSLLDTGIVIGLNRWPKFDLRMDYYLVVDTDTVMQEYPEVVRGVRCPKFMQKYDHVPDAPGDYWFTKNRETLPLTWDGSLSWVSTCACAAMNLAAIMGAKEIVLFGVDLLGYNRADGSLYDNPEHWQTQVKAVNTWVQEFQKAARVPVYKTLEQSPLSITTLSF
jgi:hypothetical protein